MGRVWALAGALFVVCIIFLLGVGFFGADSLKFAGVIVGSGAAAAYLPGGVALSRAVYLFAGVLVGALGFLLGAMLFPDTDNGVFLGAVVPIIIAAIITMWSRKPEAFITMLLGSGSLAAYYTTAFFTDPQSINYTLPIAIGGVLAPIGIGYLAAAIIKTVLPGKSEQESDSVEPTPPSSDQSADSPEQKTEALPLADLSSSTQGANR